MREAIDKAAKVIESKLRGPSPAPTSREGHPTARPVIAGDGVHQNEEVQ
jgi:ribosomal protein S10